MTVAELVFRRDGEDILHVRLDPGETCIGRHPTNDVVVPSEEVPEVAALVVDRGDRFTVRDLADGLTINGKAIDGDEVDLTGGDILTLGPFELRFDLRTPEQPNGGGTRLRADEGGAARPAALTFEGNVFALPADQTFNIGGDDGNDLVLSDEFVSGFHCRISRQDGRWILADLASTNGTVVNGLKTKEAELPDRATVQVGTKTLVFEVEAPPATAGFAGMVGESDRMQRVFGLIDKLASAAAPVLITGASGSGKELVARALHDHSPHKDGPFLAINCGALASSIIEAELFGHVKGAFTGALSEKKGAFEATQGGTLLLDEVGELPLELQPKLLRALESKTVRRVGGTEEIPIDTRIVAATHCNLKDMVDDGDFRRDLFHRLYVLTIALPDLCDRPEDVVPLAEHFLADQAPGRTLTLTDDARVRLTDYHWPGNVRELKNVMVRAMWFTERDSIDAADLAFSEDAFSEESARERLREVDEEERKTIIDVLDEVRGNRAEAARRLGVSKSTFHDRLKRLGVGRKYRRR